MSQPTSETQPTAAGHVRSSSQQGIGWIVLDNIAKHNAISLPMWRGVIDALAAFEQDPAIRCVVIRGAGERAFCAGADIAEKEDVDGKQGTADLDVGLAGLGALKSFPKPLIAMVSGYCIGAGMGIATACDLRIAAPNASFGVPVAKMGLGYPYVETKRLVDLIGPGMAKQMLFTADRLDAERALRVGLVNEVVAPGELLQFTTAMAERIAANAPLTIAAAKHAIATALSDPADRDTSVCEQRARACLGSDDYAEGRRAFKEKRPPVFRGR